MTKLITAPNTNCSAELAWSRKSDGPMNTMAQPSPLDNERIANRMAFVSRNFESSVALINPRLLHGSLIVSADDEAQLRFCDGLYTTAPGSGLVLSVGFADCPSVALLGPNCLMLLHAGWRGIASGIVEKAVQKMIELGISPLELTVFIGPSIRACCYEVDADTAEQVDGLNHIGKVMLDLPDIITARLVAKGVQRHEIQNFAECTYHTTYRVVKKSQERFTYFSWRRDHDEPLRTQIFTAKLL